MKKIKGFTLTEMIICTLLAGIVIFFVYTIMLSANKSYVKLYKDSKNKNDIVYFKNLLRKSVMNANIGKNFRVLDNGKKIEIGYYDSNFGEDGGYRVDVYEFSSSSNDVVERAYYNSHNGKSYTLKTHKLSDSSDIRDKEATVDLYVYSGKYNPNNQTIIPENAQYKRKERLLNNVVHVFYDYQCYGAIGSGGGVADNRLFISIVYKTILTKEDYEYHSDFFIFKNKNYYSTFQ